MALRKKNFVVLIIILIVALVVGRNIGRIRNLVVSKVRPQAKLGALSPDQIAGQIVPVKAYKVARIDFRDTLPTMGNIRGFFPGDK